MTTFRQYIEDLDAGWEEMFPLEKKSTRSGRAATLPENPSLKYQRETDNIPLRLSYAVYNVFQRYWDGQADPLYAVLSRRGSSVDWVNMEASPEEVERLKQVANEILTNSQDRGEIATAKQLLSTLPK